MTMYREKRFEEIKRLLTERKELSIEDIMQAVGVSRDTARRDVVALAASGAGRRTRGGIVSLTFGHTVPSYSERLKLFSKEKTAMARQALSLIKPGGVYFIDDSTTLLKLSQSIDVPVTIYTHSLDNAIALAVKSDVTLRVLGGKLNHHGRFFFQPENLTTLGRIAFDAAFIGATAMSAAGVYFPYADDADVKATLAQAARQVIVVSETQKFQIQAPYRGFPLAAVDVLITERALTKQERGWFAGQTQFMVAGQ
ncbi:MULTISPECIES: DeoR/GlpR family DNA-binding transcription regulator [unclassified Lacticaseibacillus]|uniref:DeoR/GlpR family DNA-binding transcription regulator n=1 Tax=unclassified Lacticaseibacillus TaxID=2759744 RepID=UPI0019451C8A|nr:MULTISPECIES: DeoR/GlpR family DNA-binding transcription regulator [unclassified Lacticaseibacillus]